MFLAQIVFSFRSLCLKTVVTDFVLPGTRGEEERGDGGLLVRGGWMRGNGQNMRSRYQPHFTYLGVEVIVLHISFKAEMGWFYLSLHGFEF